MTNGNGAVSLKKGLLRRHAPRNDANLTSTKESLLKPFDG